LPLQPQGGASQHPPFTAADIRRIVAAHPEYRFEVWKMRSVAEPEHFVAEVELALNFLRGPFLWIKPKILKGRHTAYSLKHMAQLNGKEHLGYVSQDAMILAAIFEGLDHRPSPCGLHAVIYRFPIPPGTRPLGWNDWKWLTAKRTSRRTGASPTRENETASSSPTESGERFYSEAERLKADNG
jgi:hypothetical protein